MTMTLTPQVYVPELAAIADRLGAVEGKLDTILAALAAIATMEVQEMADFSALAAEVTANGDVVSSAVTLLEGIEQQLATLELADAGDQSQVDSLREQLSTQRSALAQAVAAGTGPAEPQPPSQPPDEQPPADETAPPPDGDTPPDGSAPADGSTSDGGVADGDQTGETASP